MEPQQFSPEEKNWALTAHLSSLSWLVGIPGFIGPLVIWLIKKDTMPFAAKQAKESLNFQISLLIYSVILVLICFTVILIPVTIIGFIALLFIEVIYTIIATMKTSEGSEFFYPLTIRLIK